MYNLLFRDYRIVYRKRSLLKTEIALDILEKSILVKNFNLHYFI